MKTILEIQKLEKQIKNLEREVDNCVASIEYKKYKAMMQTGREKFTSLDNQASDIIKSFNNATNKLSKYKGNSEILKKKNTQNINLDNISALIEDANSLLGDVSEENRCIEDLVRSSEELTRKNAALAKKLTEIKTRLNAAKVKIEQKRQEVAPKIAEIEKKIKALEPKIEDKEKYEKYKELKQKIELPIYVGLQDVFCGGCKMELSLNFIEKLKAKKMLPCEHCGRIIMLDK